MHQDGDEKPPARPPDPPPTDSWPSLPAPAPGDSTGSGFLTPLDATPSAGIVIRGPGVPPTDSWPAIASGPALTGQTLGRYQIRRVIGRGGMGVVYEAWDPDQRRTVALKTLHTQAGASPDGTAVERFIREARSAARLRHPAIVTILDVDEDRGTHFFTMEYVEGKSLEKSLRDGEVAALTVKRRVELVAEVAEALGHAHHAGVIHRDVKPSNILLNLEGRPMLTDFGLAAEAVSSDLERITLAGVVLGTPQYVSPEQASGGSRRAVPASDVWSLGVVLYRVLSGQLPFLGEGAQALEAVLTRDPVPLRRVNPHIPPVLEAICLKCLSRDPGKRYPDGTALAADLRRFLQGRPVEAGTAGRGRRLVPAAAVAIALLAALTGGAALIAGRRSRSAAAPPPASAARSPETPKPPDPVPAVSQDRDAALREARIRADALRILDPARVLLDGAVRSLEAGADWAQVGETVDGARRAAERAVQKLPGLAAARQTIGRCRLLSGDRERATEELRQAVRLDPESTEARGELGRLLAHRAAIAMLEEALHDGRPDTPRARVLRQEAAGELQSALRRDPPTRSPLQRRILEALLAWTRGDPEKAASLCSGWLATHNDEPGRGELSWLAGMMGAGDARGRSWNEAVMFLPGEPLVLYSRGISWMLQKDWERAARDLDLAVRVQPGFAEAVCARAVVLWRRGRTEEAGAAFERAIELAPESASPWAQRAGVGFETRDKKASIADFTEAIRRSGDHAWVFEGRGVLLSDTGDQPGAIADFDRALSLFPSDSRTLYRRGLARSRKADPQGAIADYDAALSLDPRSFDAWYQRGISHLALGNWAAAATGFTRALDINPEAFSAWSLRGTAMLKQGRWKEACADYDEAVERGGATAGLHFNRALARQQLQDLKGAEEDYRASLRLEPANANSWLCLANLLQEKGDADGARAAAQEALKVAPADWSHRAEAEQLVR